MNLVTAPPSCVTSWRQRISLDGWSSCSSVKSPILFAPRLVTWGEGDHLYVDADGVVRVPALARHRLEAYPQMEFALPHLPSLVNYLIEQETGTENGGELPMVQRCLEKWKKLRA